MSYRPDRSNEWWRLKRLQFIESRGEQCECRGECGRRHATWLDATTISYRCPFTAPLEIAHCKDDGMNGRNRPGNQRIIAMLRNPDAYLVLCRPCHMLFDGIGGPR